jgi:hypothetical protein
VSAISSFCHRPLSLEQRACCSAQITGACEFQRSAQAPQMPIGSRELSRQKRLDDVPSDDRPHGSSTHANDIHVIILDLTQSGESSAGSSL